MRKFVDAEIDRTVVRFIRKAFFNQRRDQRYHLRHVIGRGGIHVGLFDVQRSEIFIKGIDKRLGVDAQRYPFFTARADRLVIHIGQIHHMIDVKTGKLEKPPQQILKHVTAQIADVGIVVNRWAASIHAYLARVDGHKRI